MTTPLYLKLSIQNEFTVVIYIIKPFLYACSLKHASPCIPLFLCKCCQKFVLNINTCPIRCDSRHDVIIGRTKKEVDRILYGSFRCFVFNQELEIVRLIIINF